MTYWNNTLFFLLRLHSVLTNFSYELDDYISSQALKYYLEIILRTQKL